MLKINRYSVTTFPQIYFIMTIYNGYHLSHTIIHFEQTWNLNHEPPNRGVDAADVTWHEMTICVLNLNNM